MATCAHTVLKYGLKKIISELQDYGCDDSNLVPCERKLKRGVGLGGAGTSLLLLGPVPMWFTFVWSGERVTWGRWFQSSDAINSSFIPSAVCLCVILTNYMELSLFEMLIVAQPLKNFIASYTTRKFIAVFTRACH
jgi:hypothetical protein